MKKISLLKDCVSKESFRKKPNNDEMIIYETNKITYTGMNILILLLVVFCVLDAIFGIFNYIIDFFNFLLDNIFNFSLDYTFNINDIDFRDIKLCIHMIIGAVNYSMLIAYCKKGIVKHGAALGSFLWSIIALPLAIVELFLGKILQENIFYRVQPIAIIIIALLLYFICNTIYKKSFDED